MIRRASVEDAGQLSEWAKRDFDDETDFAGFLANELNVCLICDDSAAYFVWHGPGVFEAHVGFVHRGRDAIRMSHEMLAIMRAERKARLFWAAVPIENRHALMFTRLMGWKSQGVAELPHGCCELFTGE